jgi:hypothetical protein
MRSQLNTVRNQAIEAWALKVIDRVTGTARFEDSRVELKGARLPEPPRAARQLAALANAARGEDVLWIVGVDQAEGVVGAESADLAHWWQQVQRQFEGAEPHLTDVAMTPGGKSVLALHFTNERAPYVVHSTMQGDDRLEVPWRDGTRTRSARRDELLRILVPQVSVPEFEIITASAMVKEYSGGENPPRWDWTMKLELYAIVDLDSHVVVPNRAVHATLSTNGEPTQEFGDARLIPPTEIRGEHVFQSSFYSAPRSEIVTAHQGDQQAILTGPGPITASAQTITVPDVWLLGDVNEVAARFEMEPMFSDERSVVAASLPRQELTENDKQAFIVACWAQG